MSHQTITMVIETAFGEVTRVVPGASPLPADEDGGRAAEEATRDAAAVWGLPDFVYSARSTRKGAATRELGDNLLVVGDLGMVVQNKRRASTDDTPERAKAWLAKNAAAALRQAHGTIRALRSGTVTLTNARSRSIDVDGAAIRWLAVAVLDHPDPPVGVIPETENGTNPAIVLLRRDWEFLYRQLKSTHALGKYFERVIPENWEIGAEPSRYFQLAQADAHTRRGKVNVELLGPGARVIGGPQLPMEPVASGDDELPRLVWRYLVEDIATGPAGDVAEDQRLRVLAEIDRLPVSSRAEMGTFALDAMELVGRVRPGDDSVLWRQRQYVSIEDDHPLHLAAVACSRGWDDRTKGAFITWLEIRHHQFGERRGRHDDLITVGIAITPRSDGVRPWDTSMIAVLGDIGLTEDEIELYERIWPLEEAAANAAALAGV